MPASKGRASGQIAIYEPFIYRRHSGYGWVQRCLELAYPNAKLVTDPLALRNFEGDVICLRGMTDEMAFYKPPFYYPREIAVLSTVRGLVIHRTTWEYDSIPAPIINLFPRADVIIVPSKFLKDRILSGFRNVFVIPDPIKPLRHRKKAGRTFRIGGMLHPSKRRNIEGWLILRDFLPRRFKISVVIAPELKEHKELLNKVQLFADEVSFELPDSDLEEFYASLDWFVSLSVGEGYGLPVREALKVGTPVICPKHTGYEDLEGIEGVTFAPTRRVSGIDYGCWHNFVMVPDAKAIAKFIASAEPPKVPDNLPLPTVEQFITEFHKILPPESRSERIVSFNIRIRFNDVIWIVPNAYPCGVREAAEIWAERTGGMIIPLSSALNWIEARMFIIAYHPNFWEWYRWLLPSFSKKIKAPIILWLHRKPSHEDEEAMLLSIADAIWATTDKLAEMTGANGILPNPIGDEPSDEPIAGLFGSFGIYKHETATLINQLAYRLPHLKFKCLWSMSPYFRDEVPVRLLSEAIENAPKNAKHLLGPFSRQQLHSELSRMSGFIIWNPPWAAPGESSARIAFVLRMKRPILANDDSPMISYYRKHIPTIQRFDADFLTTLLLRPLDPYVPCNVPTLEEEIALFKNLIRMFD
jgi:hypothetical protein